MSGVTRCRHRDIWITSGTAWCYRCGAFRGLRPRTTWVRPVGADGKNPANKMRILESKEG